MAKSEEPWRLSFSEMVSPIEDIIEEARNGRMFILVDDESRENERDLVIPAQMATPDAMNFLARYGRGLICLAMVRQRIEAHGLPLLSRKYEIGRAHGRTPVTNAHLVCSLTLEK